MTESWVYDSETKKFEVLSEKKQADRFEQAAKKAYSDILKELDRQEIYEVEAQFYGGGDCGEIQDINFSKEPSKEEVIKVLQEDYENSDWVEDENGKPRYMRKYKDVMMSVEEAVESLSYRVIESTGHDWYNNEGGGGKIHIKKADGKWSVHLYMYQNIVESHDCFDEVVTI